MRSVSSDGDEREVLAGIASIAETLRAGAAASEAEGRLVDASVAALRAQGLWRLRLCRELGGLELPIVSQIRALAAIAAEDASSAWCTMVANNAVAVLGATMPAAAVERVFADGVPACSIVPGPGGVATPVEGGYVVSGRWRLASAIHSARWVHATALIERDPSRVLPMAIPAGDVTLVDSWNVVGLSGTGSNDFTLDQYFLPGELAGREDRPYGQIRGTRRYDLNDFEQVESYEHLAFAIGMGRRALRELRLVLATPPGGRHVARWTAAMRRGARAASSGPIWSSKKGPHPNPERVLSRRLAWFSVTFIDTARRHPDARPPHRDRCRSLKPTAVRKFPSRWGPGSDGGRSWSRPGTGQERPAMPDTLRRSTALRRGGVLVVTAALAIGSRGPALAQSSTTPPPTAPTASPLPDTASAPANPGDVRQNVTRGVGAGTPATADDATKPLANATTPPGITKPGQ